VRLSWTLFTLTRDQGDGHRLHGGRGTSPSQTRTTWYCPAGARHGVQLSSGSWNAGV
jgi:hypothetical protein